PAVSRLCIAGQLLVRRASAPALTVFHFDRVPSRRLAVFSADAHGGLRDLPSFPTRRSSDLRTTSRPTAPWLCSSATPSRPHPIRDRKSTRLNSSHVSSSYAVFCLKKQKQ